MLVTSLFQLRPLYVMSHEMDRVRKGLKWLCDKAYYTGPNNTGDDLESKVEFTCYDLPYFFWRLIEEAPYEYEKKVQKLEHEFLLFLPVELACIDENFRVGRTYSCKV